MLNSFELLRLKGETGSACETGSKQEYGKEKTAKVSHHYDPRPQPLRHTSEEEIVELKRRLTDIGSNAAFLHVLGPPTQIPLPSHLHT